MSDDRPRHEIPYLHVRPPRRIVGVGGEGEHPSAEIVGNRAGLLRLRGLVDRALAADEGLAAVEDGYREIDGRRYDLMVFRAHRPDKMGDPREPDPPDYSKLA